jgi:hypothetical protein
MKKFYSFALTSIVIALTVFFSCVDGNYSIDDVNKNGAFSHEDGLFIPLGNLDTIRFHEFETSTPIEVTYTKTVEGIFSGDLYKNFVIPNKGKDESLGQITFSGDFLSAIANPIPSEFSNFVIAIHILKKNGEESGISIADQTLQTAITDKQIFDMVIAKEEVSKLKEAYTLQIIFTFSSKKVEESDYVLIHNLKLKLSGGIRITME